MRASRPLARGLMLAGIIGIGVGCREKRDTRAAPATRPTIACLVPAATDLLIGMGAADQLVAVSNFDTVREGTAQLPRVGDYFTTDWEMLSGLQPTVMIIQLANERVPAGLTDRAKANGIELTNLVLDRLADIYPAAELIGRAAGEPRKAEALTQTLRRRLDALENRVKGRPKVKTLLVLDEDGGALVGAGNFLDDLLQIAGGENVAASLGSPWPTADKEKLGTLAPEVILILDPNPRPDALETARRFWATLPETPAVRSRRIYLIGDWYVLLNGAHVADIADAMAARLHPVVATRAVEPERR